MPTQNLNPHIPRFVVSALVTDPLAEPLAMLRRRLDRWSKHWIPPHLTIIPPFSAELTDGQRHQIVSHPFPLDIQLTDVGRFRHFRTGVVWYGVDAPDLAKRTEELFATLPWLRPFADRRPSSPHVTVASRIPNHELTYVETSAAASNIKGSATIQRLSLYRWDTNSNEWISTV